MLVYVIFAHYKAYIFYAFQIFVVKALFPVKRNIDFNIYFFLVNVYNMD